MPKSDFARQLDEIQSVVAAYLKTRAFKKSGRTFNREVTDGLVQVVNLQMGPFPIGDYVMPSLRENLYGKFAVNLGVTLPCVSAFEHPSLPKKVFQEYHCRIRKRLSSTLSGKKEEWWEIGRTDRTGTEIATLLERDGIPFLEQFSSYADVLAYFKRRGDLPFMTDARSAVDAALIHRHLGHPGQCARLLKEAKRRAPAHRGFQEFVSSIQTRLAQNG